jgi:hypothetical protein
MKYRSVSEVARVLGVRPRDVSDLFYQRLARDDMCPVVGGRRLIPACCVSEIEELLRERGLLSTAKQGGEA